MLKGNVTGAKRSTKADESVADNALCGDLAGTWDLTDEGGSAGVATCLAKAFSFKLNEPGGNDPFSVDVGLNGTMLTGSSTNPSFEVSGQKRSDDTPTPDMAVGSVDMSTPPDLSMSPDMAWVCDAPPSMCSAPALCDTVQGTYVASDPPTETGGTVVDGVYVAVADTVYTGTSGMTGNLPSTLRMTLAISSGTYALTILTSPTDMGQQTDVQESGTVAFNQQTLTATATCPAPGGGASGYSVSGNQLTLLLESGPHGPNERVTFIRK